ncbi:MAG: gamma-aminobutyrate dehydratase [Gemmatimonadetes bacterium]|nr:gamma-aminobutyrate dehydratase [Gemmatimonadota bacterium]|tara:strand:+ start:7711 stop:9150 length:1440 start_codon:yes stop_codon:yes gene_type:complete
MGLRSPAEFKEGLCDGREVYYRGERIEDVVSHHDLGIGVDHVALDFAMAEDPTHRDLMTWQDPHLGEAISRYFKIPSDAEDLLKRREMIELSTRLGGGVVLLIKEIGSDALFALDLVSFLVDKELGTQYRSRVQAFIETCKEKDLSLAVAQTDVKGDRSLLPSQQEHPDYYVHIVEERPDGIVVRGAKAHTTCAPYVDELVVLPTRAFKKDDAAYAVSFAIPVNTPGVKLIASPFGSPPASTFHHPVSSKHRMIDTLTVFDNVFIPNERIFLKGEWQFAGALANTFVEYHRYTAVSYKPPLCDLFIGSAALLAHYNGIGKASHVREKLTKLISYAETVRGLSLAAAYECSQCETGSVVPNVIYSNLAKFHFANGYHEAVSWVQDIAGGLVVTGPSEEDWLNPQTRPYIERFLGGSQGVVAEDRLRALNLVRDLTASTFGGYNELLAIHAEGSLETQKITILRDYDVARCVELVEQVLRS